MVQYLFSYNQEAQETHSILSSTKQIIYDGPGREIMKRIFGAFLPEL